MGIASLLDFVFREGKGRESCGWVLVGTAIWVGRMEDRIGEDDYEELGEEQKVAIGRWFLMNAPPGQVLQVAKGINNLFVLALWLSRSLDVVSV